MSFDRRLKSYQATIDSRLAELLPPDSQKPTPLHEAMRYSCLAPGKRLRPVLALAWADGGKAAIDAGCAIEMVHCFSLIHDDLPAIDNDDLRRGRPTCHRQFGEAVAILAGDALFALAFEVLGGMDSAPEHRLSCIQELSKAVGSDGLVGGEMMDILSEGSEPDPETLDFIHTRKTGALIRASCVIGAILGGADKHHAREYGSQIGLAFQIADDILNETSTAEQLGKAVGSDRERKKATFPALYGLDGARKAADRAVETALGCLKGAPNSDFLADMARYSVERLH